MNSATCNFKLLRGISIAGILFLGLLRAHALELRVVDGRTGKPISNVSVGWSAGGEKKTATANAQGTVTIALSNYPSLEITTKQSGFVPMTMRWAAGKVPARFDLRLPKAQSVGGRVIDESGAAIPDARITLIIPQRIAGPFVVPENLSARSDTNGGWRCDSIPKGAAYVQVEVAHSDFEIAEVSPPLEALIAGKAESKMISVATVVGRVIDETGNAVEGAEVVLGAERGIWPGSSTSETTADSRGQFEFRRVRSQKRLLGVHANNWAPSLQTIDVKRDMAPIEVRLTRGTPLAVRVVDVAGTPLAGVNINVDEWPSSLRTTRAAVASRWSYPGWEWRTDAEGRFVWSNAPPEPTSFTFRKGGYMTRSRHNLNAAAEEQRVALGQTFYVSGKVTDAQTGKPLPEFTINARFATVSWFRERGMTNYGPWQEHNRKQFRNGEFTCAFDYPLLSGSKEMHDWQFRAEAAGYEPRESRVVRDAERGTNIEFQLAPRALPEIAVAVPTNRVTAGISVRTNRVHYGDTFEVFVKTRIAPGFYIYALEDSGSRNLPTSLAGPTSPFFKADGPWRGPEPKLRDDGSRALTGDVLFHRSFVLVDQGVGPGFEKVPVELRFQVCNDALCWPPETIRLETRIETLTSR